MAQATVPLSYVKAKFFRQQFERSYHKPFRVLPKLPVEVRIVINVDAAFENFRIGGSIKEARSDAQRSNPIASSPRGAYLIGLPIHFACQLDELTIQAEAAV